VQQMPSRQAILSTVLISCKWQIENIPSNKSIFRNYHTNYYYSLPSLIRWWVRISSLSCMSRFYHFSNLCSNFFPSGFSPQRQRPT